MSRIVVLGSVNDDLVARGPRLPAAGETVLGGEFYRASGGKGANQAVAAARLSRESVTLVAAVGQDPFGADFLENARKENLDCRHVKQVPHHPTGVALILVDQAGQNQIMVASGANADLMAEDVNVLPNELFHAGGLFLASLESPVATVIAGLERAKRAGMITVLNPAPADVRIMSPDVMRLIDVLTPNENEAAILSGCEVQSLDSAALAAQKLRAAGCGAVIVTLGEQGCVMVDGATTHIPAPKVQAVDATAAGDCFNGALAVALAEGRSLVQAARWATHAAAISVTRAGAQPSLPKRDEVPAAGF